MAMQSIKTLLDQIFSEHSMIYCVLSSPCSKDPKIQKATIRQLGENSSSEFQITSHSGPQVFHTNVTSHDCCEFIENELVVNFAQALICTPKHDYHILVSKKKKITIIAKPPTKKLAILPHNRTKNYLLAEGMSIDFLVELGIMDSKGKVIASKRNKFKQLNRFVEIIADVLPNLSKDSVLEIIDFGCGKAYLTFALYYFLVIKNNYKVNIHGLDLKQDVIEFCNSVAKKLNYKGLSFSVGDIDHFKPKKAVNLVISLHACDTATDAAIEKAVRWNADVIMCVPCCQKELMPQIQNDSLNPLLMHGILKERFASLATDAARAQILNILGYKTQVLEFIDLEHTPKNLLIRAIKKPSKQDPKQAVVEYIQFKNALSITPSLEKRFKRELEL